MMLWLVRHAQAYSGTGICYGSTDLLADPQGTRDAAAALALALPEGVRVRSSPLRRCLALAEELRRLRPDLLPHAVDRRIAEMDFGSWEGERWDRIGRAAFEAWGADFEGYRCGGGESVSDLMVRVGDALADAREASAEQVWITHAGVTRAARLLARGILMPRRMEDWPDEAIPFGGWERLPIAPG